MGDRLKRRNEKIQLFVSSPANRAISTARLMAESYGYPLEKILQAERLYLPSVKDFLVTFSEMDEKYDTAIFFAHNPGITEATEYLSGEGIGNMPTCGIAKIVFPETETWSEISGGAGTMEFFDYPKREFDSGGFTV